MPAWLNQVILKNNSAVEKRAKPTQTNTKLNSFLSDSGGIMQRVTNGHIAVNWYKHHDPYWSTGNDVDPILLLNTLGTSKSAMSERSALMGLYGTDISAVMKHKGVQVRGTRQWWTVWSILMKYLLYSIYALPFHLLNTVIPFCAKLYFLLHYSRLTARYILY